MFSTIIFIDLALTFVFQILDEWIHFQAALLHITVVPPKASEPFIRPLAMSTSFRALRGEHFGILRRVQFSAFSSSFTFTFTCASRSTLSASSSSSSRLSLHFYAAFIYRSTRLASLHLRCNHLLEYLYMVGIPFPVYWSTVSLPHSGYRDCHR